MNIKFQYKSLIESLKLLSASYENQVKSLPEFVNVQEEVISIFNDAFLLLPQLIESNLITMIAIAWIIRCFNWINILIKNEKTAKLKAFKNHKDWQKIRKFANKALEELKEEKGMPDLSHINWID